MPMPCGRVPRIAAWTRSGARKASEIVMFTLRAVQPSRLAIDSAFAVASVTSSSSQRRPRAIDATKVARFSERIRRMFCGDIPLGRRISRRRVDTVFCHGMLSVFSRPARSFTSRPSCESRMITRSRWTSTRAMFEKAGDGFKVRWRDHADVLPVTRSRYELALVNPTAA
jgi:hypothetical protein